MTDIIDQYNQMLERDEDFERVGWGSVESQNKRFKILTEIGDIDNCSVLDVGCGLGALYEYFCSNKFNIAYTGVDINDRMIQVAQNRNPDVEFIKTNLVSDSNNFKNRKFDYSFVSGAFNLSEEKHSNHLEQIFKTIFGMSNKGVAVNFLSIYADYFSPGEIYHNPIVSLELALSISRKVVLRQDYMSHDFTIYIYK